VRENSQRPEFSAGARKTAPGAGALPIPLRSIGINFNLSAPKQITIKSTIKRTIKRMIKRKRPGNLAPFPAQLNRDYAMAAIAEGAASRVGQASRLSPDSSPAVTKK